MRRSGRMGAWGRFIGGGFVVIVGASLQLWLLTAVGLVMALVGLVALVQRSNTNGRK